MSEELPRRAFLRITLGSGAALALGSCEPMGEAQPSDDTGDEAPVSEMPPITPNEDFYIQSYAGTPDIDLDAWALSLEGLASGSLTLSLAELQALGGQEKEHTLICIGSSPDWKAIDNALWTGLPLATILDELGVEPQDEAIELQFECADGYTTALPISDLSDRDLWFVWEMNGVPLPASHGAPLRALVPDRYGMKNPKWITRLSFGLEPLLGTWERSGWSNGATIHPIAYSRHPSALVPQDNAVVPILGSATAGAHRPTVVEVSDDGGASWSRADFVYEGPEDTWVLWQFDWTPPGPGTHVLLVRVEDETGRASDPDWPNGLEGYGGYDVFELRVVDA